MASSNEPLPTRRHSARRVLLSLTSVGLVALAACGGNGSASTPKVASLGESTTTPPTSDTGANGTDKKGDKDDMQQAALDFAKCMRAHGIDFADPQFTGDGGMVFSAGGEAGSGPDKDKMDAAQKACQPIMDKAQANLPAPDPKEIEEQKQQALAFSKCMREHGIDFPDPTFDGKGGVQIQIEGGEGTQMDPNSPAMKKANEECSKQTGMPLPHTQGGPGNGPAPVSGASTKGDS